MFILKNFLIEVRDYFTRLIFGPKLVLAASSIQHETEIWLKMYKFLLN